MGVPFTTQKSLDRGRDVAGRAENLDAKQVHAPLLPGPTAQDCHLAALDVNPVFFASQVRMQKPKPDRICECILDYLKSLQDGDPLAPDRSSLKKPNVAIPDDQSQIIAKCLAEVIGQQPSKEEVLGLLVKAFEKAVEG